MLSDAIDEIHREFEAAADRRNQELERRADVRRADDFLLSIEDIIENRRGAVPAPLMDEITRFVRALTAPLAVNASVADGDHAVVRNSAVVLAFNQDMDLASVENGFRITPLAPFTVVVKNPRTFEFHPWLQPDTAYRIRVIGARK